MTELRYRMVVVDDKGHVGGLDDEQPAVFAVFRRAFPCVGDVHDGLRVSLCGRSASAFKKAYHFLREAEVVHQAVPGGGVEGLQRGDIHGDAVVDAEVLDKSRGHARRVLVSEVQWIQFSPVDGTRTEPPHGYRAESEQQQAEGYNPVFFHAMWFKASAWRRTSCAVVYSLYTTEVRPVCGRDAAKAVAMAAATHAAA